MASAEQLSRLEAVVPAAQASARKWGVPASVTLAQWIFESSWGVSQLAVKANNFFGVKFSHFGKTDAYVEMPTAEFVGGKKVIVEAQFAKYADAAESFEAHAALLAMAPRYKAAMAVGADPAKFVTELGKAGYSTNPEYGYMLLSAIKSYGLMRYEIEPPVAAGTV